MCICHRWPRGFLATHTVIIDSVWGFSCIIGLLFPCLFPHLRMLANEKSLFLIPVNSKGSWINSEGYRGGSLVDALLFELACLMLAHVKAGEHCPCRLLPSPKAGWACQQALFSILHFFFSQMAQTSTAGGLPWLPSPPPQHLMHLCHTAALCNTVCHLWHLGTNTWSGECPAVNRLCRLRMERWGTLLDLLVWP